MNTSQAFLKTNKYQRVINDMKLMGGRDRDSIRNQTGFPIMLNVLTYFGIIMLSGSPPV
jgi:hypothetical protein